MLEKVLTGKLTFRSLKPCDLSSTNKQEIKAYFENSYDLDESMFAAFKDDSVFYKCPDALRLPMIFYYGHTACVYINKLILADLIQPEDRMNIKFETMFETGVDEMSWDDTENYRMGGKFEWPLIDDVIEYRRAVREVILRVIEMTPLDLPITMDSPWWGLFMCMEHQRIHTETSSVLIRQLPVEMVTKPDGWTYGPIKAEEPVNSNPILGVPSCDVIMGKPQAFPSFGWDNEYGSLCKRVPAFQASKYLVTNRDFLQFVQGGGYELRHLWTKDGWSWKDYRKAVHPTFWVCTEGCRSGCGADLKTYTHCTMYVDEKENEETHYNNNVEENFQLANGSANGHKGAAEGGGITFRLRCMFDVMDMPWDWPVEVNYHEAKAYCEWTGPGWRLLSEAEHHVIRADEDPSIDPQCDIIYGDDVLANLNLKYGSSTPVNFFPSTSRGFHDAMGNVWEWVEDHFNGLPGFRSSFLYDDFSSPCFDGRHNEILGGSWVSTGDEASRFARFAFRRHFFQHCGFRLARSTEVDTNHGPVRLVKTSVFRQDQDCPEDGWNGALWPEYIESTYEHYVQDNEETLNQSLNLEYSEDNSPTTHIIMQLTAWVDDLLLNKQSCLHLGCATGRVDFELLSYVFEKVTAIDYCGRLVDACVRLQSGRLVTFTGDDATDKQEVKCPEPSTNCQLTFKQLTWLPNELDRIDFVLASFFDRTHNVKAWTARLKELVRPDGLLVVVSRGCWTEKSLEPLLSPRFQLTDERVLGSSENSTVMTAWKRQ